MGQACFRMLVGVAAIGAALVVCGSATASSTCASRLLADWRDGGIDRTYAVPCYRRALAKLPEDVLVYSTAREDITRALQARLGDRERQAAKANGESGGGGVSPVLIIAVTALLIVGAGSVAAALR